MKRIRMFGVLLICILSFSVETFGGIQKLSVKYIEPPKNLTAEINYHGIQKYVECCIRWDLVNDNLDDSFDEFNGYRDLYSCEVRVDDDIVARRVDMRSYSITFTKESQAKTHTVYVRRIIEGKDEDWISEWVSININIEAYHEYSLSTKITKLEEKNYHTAKIYWKKVNEPCHYEVLRSERKNGEYESIATLTGTSYTDKDVIAGKKYYYRIRVSIDVHGLELEEWSKAKLIKIKGKPLTPKIKVSASKKNLKIKWGTITDNSSWIEIYMKNGHGEYRKYKMINRTINIKKKKKKRGITGIQSSIDTLQKGITYRFKARTCAIVNDRLLYSKWSKVKTVKRK